METEDKKFFEYIQNHKDDDVTKLRLAKKNKEEDFDINKAILQIECRKKYAKKLKDFLIYPQFLFYDGVSGEQCSHQAIAHYHADLVKDEGNVLDATAGLGIDAFTIAQNCSKVTAIELNEGKATVLKHNAEILGLKNLTAISDDCIKYLKEEIPSITKTEVFDTIFIDPSRRDEGNKRLYNLRDCSPDVILNEDLLCTRARRVLIKVSPLLDLTQTLKDFKYLKSFKAIGVKGECKEVLLELSKVKSPGNELQESQTIDEMTTEPQSSDLMIEAINLDNEGNVLSSFVERIGEEGSEGINDISYLSPEEIKEGNYLLEPSAMVMKLAPWGKVCRQYNAKKFSPSSHLFCSPDLPHDFSGRVTRIEKVLTKKDRQSLKGLPASVVTRNYPETPEKLRKEMGLREGDRNFVYATRIGNKTIMLLTSAVSE